MTDTTYSQIATFFGISRPAVHHWFLYKRIPAERVADLEWFFKGKYTAEKMRPDLKWVRVPDRRWPHRKGRPCLDVATVANRRAK